jgi:hypothetical protein
MTTYSFSQLEQLWEQAGGSSALASYAAATAIIESGGNPDAYNPSGATGLWQIEYPGSDVLGYSSSELDDAADNAKAAVALSGNTLQGLLDNWTKYETINGIPATEASVLALAASLGGSGTTPSSSSSTSSSSSSSSSSSTSSSASNASTVSDVGSLISGASGLLRDVATALDYFFGMFGRGQGWRLVFTILTLVLLFGSYKALVSAGAVPSIIPSAVPVVI